MNLFRITHLILVIFFTIGLTACATLPAQNTSVDEFDKVLTEADQKQFDQHMDVSKDGETVNWNNEDGNIAFQLTADNTHVNEKGQACRDYVLLIHQDYQRQKTIHSTACRDNGSWE